VQGPDPRSVGDVTVPLLCFSITMDPQTRNKS
jgi:hypothetical protein